MAKITLELGKGSEDRIARLQRVLDAKTVVDVIRKALKLLEYLVVQVLEGKEFLLRDRDTGEIERVTILDLVPETEFQVTDELEALA